MRHPLTARVCTRCGLDSAGGAARELARLDGEVAVLSERRARLLAALGPGPLPDQLPVPPLDRAPTGAVGTEPGTGPPRRSAQQVLLVTGAVLLASALLVFAGATYTRLDTVGRAGVVGLLTLVAGGSAAVLASRGLRATAEVAGSLSVLLLLLDAFAARAVDLAGAGGTDLGWYTSVALAAAGVLTLTLRPTGLWVVRLTVPALLHASLAVAVVAHAGSAARAAVVLAVIAVLDAVLVRLRVQPRQLVGYGTALAVAATSAAGVASRWAWSPRVSPSCRCPPSSTGWPSSSSGCWRSPERSVSRGVTPDCSAPGWVPPWSGGGSSRRRGTSAASSCTRGRWRWSRPSSGSWCSARVTVGAHRPRSDQPSPSPRGRPCCSR